MDTSFYKHKRYNFIIKLVETLPNEHIVIVVKTIPNCEPVGSRCGILDKALVANYDKFEADEEMMHILYD